MTTTEDENLTTTASQPQEGEEDMNDGVEGDRTASLMRRVVPGIGIVRVEEPSIEAPLAQPAAAPLGCIDYDLLKKFEFTPPPECPVFYPTPEEFALGPIEYINKIRATAEPCGICKIVPPKGFKFPFVIDKNEFKFSPRVQRLNELESTTRNQLSFYDHVFRFWSMQGLDLKTPLFERKTISLYEFHKAVAEEGGFEFCTRDKKWAKIAAKMKLTKNSASQLRSYYEKHLFPYDVFKSGVMGAIETKTDDKDIDNKNGLSASIKQEEEEDGKAEVKVEDSQLAGTSSNLEIVVENDENKPTSSNDLLSPNSKNSELKKLSIYGAGPRMSGVDDSCYVKPSKYCCLCGLSYQACTMLTCLLCTKSFHKACLIPPMTRTPKADRWHCFRCLTIILPPLSQSYTSQFGFYKSTFTYSLGSFGEMADNYKRAYFKASPNNVPYDVFEKEFWRLTASFEPYVAVEYGADLHTRDYGSGFPKKSNTRDPSLAAYLDSHWNLNNLPTSPGSVFEHINSSIDGMSVPWMYVGMCFSAFCWHIEDHWTYSVNYLHWGDAKTWYGVPGKQAERFEAAMRDVCPDLFQCSPDLLHHLVTTCNPNKLQARGLPIYRTNQEAGQFVVTFPRSYHAGFNQGFNFAEAVNFATCDWLPIGRLSMSEYARVHRYPVFSHDELVCRIADETKALDLRLSRAIYDDLKLMITTEKRLRYELLNNGVNETQRSLLENFKDDERKCDYCLTTNFLSALKCICSHKLVCLYHADHLCEKCSPEQMTLIYRYSMDELKLMEERLARHLAIFNDWSAKVNKIVQKVENYDNCEVIDLEDEDEDDQLKVKIDDLLHLLDFADTNKFNIASSEYARLKQIVQDVQHYTSTARLIIKSMDTEGGGGGAAAGAAAADSDKNTSDTLASRRSLSKEKQSKRLYKLDELQSLMRQVNRLSFAIPEVEQLSTIHRRVFQASEKIARLLKKSPTSMKAKDVNDVLEEARPLASVIDLGHQLKQLELKHTELDWLERHDCVFKQATAPITLTTVDELLQSALTMPSVSPVITKKITSLQSIKEVGSKWIEKVESALTSCHKLSRPAHAAKESASKINDERLPSVEFLEALKSWCDGNRCLRTSDYSIDLNPQYQQLESTIQVCKAWNGKAEDYSLIIQKGNAERMPTLVDIEKLIEEANEIQCRLEKYTFFANIVANVRGWIEHLGPMLETSQNKLYRSMDAMIPRRLTKSISTTYTTRNAYFHLSRKVSYDRKQHPFLQALKDDQRSPSVSKLFREWCNLERQTVVMLREKHANRRAFVQSITLDGTPDKPKEEGAQQTQEAGKSEPSLPAGTKLCFCGKDFDDFLVECWVCRDWFHRSCINVTVDKAKTTTTTSSNGSPVGKRSKKNRAQSQQDGQDINRQELHLCCLCSRSRRPKVKEIDGHLNNLKKLCAQFVEGDVFRCYRDRIHAWQARVKVEMRRHSQLHMVYGRVLKARGETRTVAPEDIVAAQVYADAEIVEDLILEGALLQADVDELLYLWKVFTLLRPDVKTVYFCPRITSKRKRRTTSLSGGDSSLKSPKKIKITQAGDKEEGDNSSDDDDEEDPCFMGDKCLVRKGCEDKDVKWVQCDKCDQWFHLVCQGIDAPSEIENISFYCTSCKDKTQQESSAAVV